MLKLLLKWIPLAILLSFPVLSHASETDIFLKDRIEIGKDYFKTGDFEKSYETFKDLFLKNPGNETINFYLGRSAFEIRKYEESVFAYQRMLISHPDLSRVKLEMARAYMALGSNQEARRLFTEVLSQNPPEDVKKNIYLLLKVIDSREKKHRLSGSVEFGYGYDDNANTTPTDEIIEIPAFSNLPMELEGKDSDFFFTSSAEVSYLYNLNSQKLNHLKTDFFYQKNIYDSKDEQNLDFINLAFTPNIRILSDLSLDISLTAQHISIDDKSYLNAGGARLTLKKTVSESSRLNLSISHTQKIYADEYDSKDGSNTGAAVSWTKGIKNLLITPFADFSREKTDSDIYSFKRYSGGIGLAWIPVSKITLSGFYRFQQSDYEEKEPLFLKKREDTASFLSGDVKWMFYNSEKRKISASLGISHLFIKNDSNADIYEYRKNKTTAYVKLNF